MNHTANEVDHIIDLNTVSICFSEAFLDCSLRDCLEVMCRLNRILNGADNLCKITPTMNTKKSKSPPFDPPVKNYMKAMEGSMQDVIDAIRAIATELETVEDKVMIFANLLVVDFNPKYELELH